MSDVQKMRAERLGASQFAEWDEKSLFPVGFDQMPLDKKINELYMGKRGLLFWSGRLAWWSCGGIALGWVVFRFVGPALGIYKLAD